jgi:hypothetical protein
MVLGMGAFFREVDGLRAKDSTTAPREASGLAACGTMPLRKFPIPLERDLCWQYWCWFTAAGKIRYGMSSGWPTGRRQTRQPHRSSLSLASDHHRHGLYHTHRCDGHARDLLRHDHDPNWFHPSSAPAKTGRIVGRHHPGGLLLRQILHNDRRPSSPEHLCHLATIDSLVGDHHHCSVIAAQQSRKAHRAPSFPVSRCSVSDIPQATSQPSSSVTIPVHNQGSLGGANVDRAVTRQLS